MVEWLARERQATRQAKEAQKLDVTVGDQQNFLSEALEVARQIAEAWRRADALSALAERMEGSDRKNVLKEALEAARQIEENWRRADALKVLAEQLEGSDRDEVLIEALKAARQIGEDWRRANALKAVAEQLEGTYQEVVLSEALEAARQIGEDWRRADALKALAERLEGTDRDEVLSEALEAARQIAEAWRRADALKVLAERLEGTDRDEVLSEALEAARQIGEDWRRADALKALAERLEGLNRENASATAPIRIGLRRPELWGPLEKRYAELRPRRILSLDGGGPRTVATIEILHEIERRLSEHMGAGVEFRLSDFFDYIAGTSTGAVVAACLARGMAVREIAEFYRAMLPQMFEKNSLLKRMSSAYIADPLREFLMGVFGDATMATGLRCLLLIVTRNQTTGLPWPISSNPEARFNDPARSDSNLRIPLWQLARASTAAPVYFPPEVIQFDANDPSRTVVLTDGGSTIYNNPAFLTYRMATADEYRLNWSAGERNLLIVSVGAGSLPRAEGSQGNVLTQVANLAGDAMSDAMYDQELSCRTIGRCVTGGLLDREVGSMIPDAPLSKDLGRQFLYARYDLPPESMATIPPGFDNLNAVEELARIGRDAGLQQVRMEHFGGFVGHGGAI
jgi:patatin-like phospholipase/acyl hydrolase